jgi:hypothetical protein
MLGIYLRDKRKMWFPEKGIEPVSVLGVVLGDEIGARGYERGCVYHALKLENGREILVQQPMTGGLGSTEDFLDVKLSAEKIKKGIEKIVLIIDSDFAHPGWVEDASDLPKEDRIALRCTLEQVKSYCMSR